MTEPAEHVVTGPLDGLTVIEVASWVAAPTCAALMADMGADVVKVEPLGGDGMRGKLRQPAPSPDRLAFDAPFQLDNRGKRSIAVDLSSAEGAALVRDLVLSSDVLVTNLLPARLRRYGLLPEDLLLENPRLVCAVVTGYGTEGPDADRAAFDLTAFFSRTGIMGMIGEPDAPPPAFRPGQGDHPTGLALLVAVLAALRERDRSGAGQVVETALLRTGAWTIGCDVQVALVDGEAPIRRSCDDAFSPMNTQYRCRDGRWISLVAQDQRRWTPLCDAVGRPDLATDERYATPAARYEHRRHLIGELAERFATRPAGDWGPVLDAVGIVWAPVATLPELIADPQATATGLFEEVQHPLAGTFRTVAAPFVMSRSRVAARGPAPEVGEHTAAVLAARGLGAHRIEALRAAGVVAGTPAV